jgi:hypothetical protein
MKKIIYKNCREKKAKEENLKIRWLAGEGQAKGMEEE